MQELIVPLTSANFRTVEGEMADQDGTTEGWFASALANVSKIGVTFGGGCNYGHGVYTTNGSARFTLLSYEITRACPYAEACSMGCQPGSETGSWNSFTPKCTQASSSLMDCGSQSVYVVSHTCSSTACCRDPQCICPGTCTGGQYLECR